MQSYWYVQDNACDNPLLFQTFFRSLDNLKEIVKNIDFLWFIEYHNVTYRLDQL